MFWLQLSTLVLINLLILALLASQMPMRWSSLAPAQHAGAGEGAYTVWHLIAEIEAEHHAAQHSSVQHRSVKRGAERGHPRIPQFPTIDPDEPTGRHHLCR
ncbi:hypothetical protein MOQ72_23460 [Saccharopolyspora sp. K220]|uniref:hypothetical protein n=1 Tax=Saccharopolyspora soli TaxID=2926618 RepID=UPI001F56856E|nr:hypothetical protein [Saccharopolyspora soli]MCI2420409.1 hypothetical protein [Saccharopolyspora soli]